MFNHSNHTKNTLLIIPFLYIIFIGKLQYPPKKSRKQQAEEIKMQEIIKKKKIINVPGLIDVEYLLSGQWHRDQRAKKEKKQKEKQMQKKMELLQWEGFPDESG